MIRTVYIYERTNFETGVRKRCYSYTINPELGELVGTRQEEKKETEENNEPTT